MRGNHTTQSMQCRLDLTVTANEEHFSILSHCQLLLVSDCLPAACIVDVVVVKLVAVLLYWLFPSLDMEEAT